ncbi:cyclin-J isoform X2 [Cimex lectularius]|uniref:Cyclin D n=1 Tax=Cimex lectularius TaxID=79782 RepID=A0A8I6RB84_CIMLE|nr:cyclin-J isoform X2 [Cimex lectularius]
MWPNRKSLVFCRIEMDEIFSWCLTTPYTLDIHRNLKERELFGRNIKFQSPQLLHRPKLVDWLKTVSEKLKLSQVTLHLGIFLLDKFMDKHNILNSRLVPAAVVCLILAAKFEEEDVQVPKFTDIPSVLNITSTPSELIHLEAFVLQSLSWNISWPTVAHFAEFYSVFAVVKGDRDPTHKSSKNLTDAVRRTMREFIDLSLSEVGMLKYLASQVAAACLLAARLDHGIRPAWPDVMVALTGYSANNLRSCLALLTDIDINYPRKRKSEVNNESGYESGSPECKVSYKLQRRE